MQKDILVSHPRRNSKIKSVSGNMFQESKHKQSQQKGIIQDKIYGLVGPLKLRSLIISNKYAQNLNTEDQAYKTIGPKNVIKKNIPKQQIMGLKGSSHLFDQSTSKQNESMSLGNSPTEEPKSLRNSLATTRIRNVIMQKLRRDLRNQLTRETRQLRKHREYRQLWEKQGKKAKEKIGKKTPSLYQVNDKSIYMRQNIDKDGMVHKNRDHYWELSLRNHSRALRTHIQGHHFQPEELEKLLHSLKGTKKVQNSIPLLPIKQLKTLQKKDFAVIGRSRAQSECQTGRLSVLSQTTSQEEVYQIKYDGTTTHQAMYP